MKINYKSGVAEDDEINAKQKATREVMDTQFSVISGLRINVKCSYENVKYNYNLQR